MREFHPVETAESMLIGQATILRQQDWAREELQAKLALYKEGSIIELFDDKTGGIKKYLIEKCVVVGDDVQLSCKEIVSG